MQSVIGFALHWNSMRADSSILQIGYIQYSISLHQFHNEDITNPLHTWKWNVKEKCMIAWDYKYGFTLFSSLGSKYCGFLNKLGLPFIPVAWRTRNNSRRTFQCILDEGLLPIIRIHKNVQGLVSSTSGETHEYYQGHHYNIASLVIWVLVDPAWRSFRLRLWNITSPMDGDNSTMVSGGHNTEY